MRQHINAYKNPITLLCCQLLNLVSILKYNTTSPMDFLSDNNKKDISLKILNNGKKIIRLADINNKKKY